MNINKGKVLFADQLRVLAFISVVAVHWLSSYFDNPAATSYITNIDLIRAENPGIYNNILPPLSNFNFGSFGVAIFFLISGFVIPFSLYTKSIKGFILSRFLRIFPTYISCSLIAITISYLISFYIFGRPYNHDLKQILLNLSLTHSIFSMLTIDAVNWTLAIEIKFYLISAMFYSYIRSGNPRFLAYYCLVVCVFLISSMKIDLSFDFLTVLFDPKQLSYELNLISYMFIGTLFNIHFRKLIDTSEFILYVILLTVFVMIIWSIGYQSDQVPTTSINYIYALILFMSCYLLRNKFSNSKIMSFLSGISFPFYALHSTAGFSIIKYFDIVHGSYYAGLIAALLFTTITSTAIHYTIEKWSINRGKKIS